MPIASIIEWLKKNFLVLILLAVIGYLVFKPANYLTFKRLSNVPPGPLARD